MEEVVWLLQYLILVSFFICSFSNCDIRFVKISTKNPCDKPLVSGEQHFEVTFSSSFRILFSKFMQNIFVSYKLQPRVFISDLLPSLPFFVALEDTIRVSSRGGMEFSADVNFSLSDSCVYSIKIVSLNWFWMK